MEDGNGGRGEKKRRREEEKKRRGEEAGEEEATTAAAAAVVTAAHGLSKNRAKSTLNPTVHAGKNGPDLSINIDTCITLGLCWPVVRMALVETVIARP